MKTTRLEMFSDGVTAIIITIMVLEMKVPHVATLAALQDLWPVFVSYILSFIYVGIYWNNHHHLFHSVKSVGGGVLWANLHLLFWLSLFPFVSGWMGENHFAQLPVVVYGFVLLMAAVAYYILTRAVIRHEGKGSAVQLAIGKDSKGIMSIILYATGMALSFMTPWAGIAIYAIVAALWIIPDRRIENKIEA